MNILFIHQNFPGQFKSLAPFLRKQGHQVRALVLKAGTPSVWKGIPVTPYGITRGSTPGIHPWITDFEAKVIRGEGCLRAALALKAEGFNPDLIVAHPGWGESLFLKEVWPRARLGVYSEFFYRPQGADFNFDPEFLEEPLEGACRLRLKNLNMQLHFEVADAAISPTHWQASTFPEPFRSKISVIHDGIDTQVLKPDPKAFLVLNSTLHLSAKDELITFVNRNLEPLRGFHVFMRALPALLRQRPHARVLIVGGNEVSYGKPPPQGTWRDVLMQEVGPQLPATDWARVHFLGKIPYEYFIQLLQISRVHVYLTYPFVLSWSLLEAMSVGCAIVASDTAPVREAIHDGETGLLVDFFDPAALVNRMVQLLEDAPLRARLGTQARAFAKAHYDLNQICLPQQLAWIKDMRA